MTTSGQTPGGPAKPEQRGGFAITTVTATTPSRGPETILNGPQLVEALLQAREKYRLLEFTKPRESLGDPDSPLSRAKLAIEVTENALVGKVRNALEGVQVLGRDLIGSSNPTITGATLDGEKVSNPSEIAGKPGVKEITNIYVLGDNEGVDGDPEAVVRMQITIGGKKLDGTQGSDIEVTRTSFTLFAKDESGKLVGTELLDSGDQRIVTVGGYSGVGLKNICSLESKIPAPDNSVSIKGSRIIDPSEAIKPDGEGDYDYSFGGITGDAGAAGVALETATTFDGSFFADLLGGIVLGYPIGNTVSTHAIYGVRPPEAESKNAEVAASEPVTPSADEEGERDWLPDPRKSTPPESLGEALVDTINYLGSSNQEEVIAELQVLDNKVIGAIAIAALAGYATPESGEFTPFELELATAVQWCNERGMLQGDAVISRGLQVAQTMAVVRDQYLSGRRQL